MKALLIDHDDSFTHNLKHWLSPIFDEVQVLNHAELTATTDHQVLEQNFKLFVLSPGPKSPCDYPQSLNLLRKINSTTPVFGVCLGFQMMAAVSGVSVSTYSPPLHGKCSRLKVIDLEFQRFQNLKVARYHSLKVDLSTVKDFNLVANSDDDLTSMWALHRLKKWAGVQFHPESFLTERSDLHLEVLQQWLNQ